MNPFIYFTVWLIAFGFRFSHELSFELNLKDVSGAKSNAKIVCQPLGNEPLQNGEKSKEQQVLWKGSNFGVPERDVLRSKVPFNVLVPDIRINATKQYRCELMSSDSGREGLKKRIHRESKDSYPAEYGTCRPGYHIAQDRCYPCPGGSYTSGQDTTCHPCPANFFSYKASASCEICPDGTKTTGPGADDENKCLDANGHPKIKSSSTWIIVGICIAIFMVALWIIIAVVIIWWFRDEDGNFVQRFSKMEKGKNKHHIYDTVADPERNIYDTVASDEHIYEDVAEDEPIYTNFIPKKKGDTRKPTKHRRTSSEVLRQLRRPTLPAKETDKKLVREREAKIKAAKKVAAQEIAKEAREAAKKQAARKEAAKRMRAARKEDDGKRPQDNADNPEDHIYEEIK